MSYRLEIGLALLLAGAIGVAVWAANRTPKPPPEDFRASTFLAGPRGSRAIYDLLVKLGRPVERRRVPLFTLSQDTLRKPAILVVLGPPRSLQAAEVQQVVQFVTQGGDVLIAGNGGGLLECAGWRLQPDPWRAESVAVIPPIDSVGRLPRVARVLSPRPRQTMEKERLEKLVKRRDPEEDPCASLAAVGRDTLVSAVDGRPVVLRLHFEGGGSITLAADLGWFTNRVWRDSDVPLVVVPLLASPAGRRGRVVLDEYHQGFGHDRQSITALTWDWLRQTPIGWAILQILAVALVWLAVMAVRFGPARDVLERRRRSPLEHLEALAAGLESAGDADTAVRRLVMGLGRRLGGGSTKTDLESLELAMRGPRGRAAVRRLRHLMNERDGGGERVLAAAQAVEDVWEELRPRTKREQF
jgi:hypothetical protein